MDMSSGGEVLYLFICLKNSVCKWATKRYHVDDSKLSIFKAFTKVSWIGTVELQDEAQKVGMGCNSYLNWCNRFHIFMQN